MTKEPSIKKNYIYRLFYEVLLLITPFITTPYVSRVLDPDGIGIYSFTTSIMAYFTLFAALGTGTYGTREMAVHRDDNEARSKLFWEIELVTVGTTLLCLLVWIGFIIFAPSYSVYYIALIPTLLATMFDISWFYTGLEKINYMVVMNSFFKILGIALIFFLVKEKSDLLLYFIINSVVGMAGSLSMWIYLPKFLVKVKFRELKFLHHLHETIIYFIPSVAISVYTVLDKTLIGLITKDAYENGYYEQATKVVNIAKSAVFLSLNYTMGARISYLFAQNKFDEIKARINKSMDFILMLAYGAAFGIAAIASVFVPLFFGDDYGPVVPLLYVMVPLLVIIGVSNCIGNQYFTPTGQIKKSTKIIIAGACVNLCFNLLLIPFFGAIGATVASIIAEMVITFLYLINSRELMGFKDIWRYSRKRLVAGTIMFLLVYFAGRLTGFIPAALLLILQVVFGAGVYVLLLALMKDKTVRALPGMVKELFRR